jgi:hypothetical protein
MSNSLKKDNLIITHNTEINNPNNGLTYCSGHRGMFEPSKYFPHANCSKCGSAICYDCLDHQSNPCTKCTPVSLCN